MIRGESALNLLLMIAGFIVWSSAFVLIYAALSVGCEFGWEEIAIGPVSLQRAVLVCLWLLHLALIALLLVVALRRFQAKGGGDPAMASFFRRSVLATAIVAGAITVFNYAPAAVLSTCL